MSTTDDRAELLALAQRIRPLPDVEDSEGVLVKAADLRAAVSALRARAADAGVREDCNWRSDMSAAPRKNWDRLDLWVVYFDGSSEIAVRAANAFWLNGSWFDSGGNLLEWERRDDETGVILGNRRVTPGKFRRLPPPRKALPTQRRASEMSGHNLDRTSCILNDLHDSEINFDISCFFDGGFDVRLGDEMNGYLCSTTAQRFENAVEWLLVCAIEHYPNSLFAKTYSGGQP